MNTKKIILCLIFSCLPLTSFAGSQDYYDFKWEMKKMEEKSQKRDPSHIETKNAEGEVIELKNDPIVFEITDVGTN